MALSTPASDTSLPLPGGPAGEVVLPRAKSRGSSLYRDAWRRLLDAGCGTGDMTRRLAAAVAPGGSVVGVDASETMLAEAERGSTDRR